MERPRGSGDPRFEAPGLRGRLGCLAASAALRAAGVAAPVFARLLGPRCYRRVERVAAAAGLGALGLDLRVEGLERVGAGPYVVVALHESLLDPAALSALGLSLRFVARDELWDWRDVGPMLRAGRHLRMSEGGDRAAGRCLLDGAAAAVADGESVAVFAQGTVLGVEVAFRRGALLLARRLGVPVLPVVVAGTHTAYDFPFSPRLHRGGRARLVVLRPRDGHMSRAEFAALEREMRSVALADPAHPPRRFDPERDGYWEDYRYEIAPEFPALRAAVEARRGARREARRRARPAGTMEWHSTAIR